MVLSPKAKRVSLQVLNKYCRKGNMARSLRDFLPSAGLSREERRDIANLMHRVVRWKKLYAYLAERARVDLTPQALLAYSEGRTPASDNALPMEYRYSCSSYVAGLFKEHPGWAEYLNSDPPTTLCVNQILTTREAVKVKLVGEHLSVRDGTLPTALLSDSSEVKDAAVLREKLVHVLDESSQLVSLLAVSLGDRVFDYCAGNGGKTLAMASLSRNSRLLFAYEAEESRSATLRRRLEEYHAVVRTETMPPTDSIDVVLLDAPCTGLGAARRNPEAKYIESPGDFPRVQALILRESMRFVRPQGFLVYVVCTITPEETSDVISSFIKEAPFEILEPPSSLASSFEPTVNGYFTRIPQGDLFFVSILQRKITG